MENASKTTHTASQAMNGGVLLVPIKKVKKQGVEGYQWGDSGTWYSTKQFGSAAYVMARRQGVAVLISQQKVKVRTHGRNTKTKQAVVNAHYRKK